VPGDTDSQLVARGLPLVVDTSAWMRAGHPRAAARWNNAARAGLLRVTPVTRLEILFSARGGANFDELVEELAALRPTSLTGSIANAAESSMRALANRSHGAHRLPITDYLVGATAQETGSAVLHYDHDYDTLAEVMEFESIWLAPPGSMP
jgi:predicted nucleic acid-binding protein